MTELLCWSCSLPVTVVGKDILKIIFFICLHLFGNSYHTLGKKILLNLFLKSETPERKCMVPRNFLFARFVQITLQSVIILMFSFVFKSTRYSFVVPFTGTVSVWLAKKSQKPNCNTLFIRSFFYFSLLGFCRPHVKQHNTLDSIFHVEIFN